MQYKIPQEIGNEDRLIGPLSLRQLIIVGIGGGLAYMIYISLSKTTDAIVYIPPMVVIILLTLAIAFFKKDNLTFTRMSLLFLEMTINPTKRVWVNFAGDISPFKLIEVFSQADIQKIEKKQAVDEKQMTHGITSFDRKTHVIINYDMASCWASTFSQYLKQRGFLPLESKKNVDEVQKVLGITRNDVLKLFVMGKEGMANWWNLTEEGEQDPTITPLQDS